MSDSVVFHGRTKYNFAYQHMEAAIHLATLSRSCEIVNRGYDFADGPFFAQYRSYVVGVIMMTVASVETRINEFYLTAVDGGLGTILNNEKQLLLSEIWQSGERQYNILEKYQVALNTINRPILDSSRQPYQEVRTLIKLRNLFVHYKPEWNDQSENYENIESNLQGKFKLNPFWKENSPFFPFGCLSFGCAEWAITYSIELVMQFLENAGYPTNDTNNRLWNRLKQSADELLRPIQD